MKRILSNVSLGILLIIALAMAGCRTADTSNTNRSQAEYTRLIVDDARDPPLYKNILVVAANPNEVISFRAKITKYRYKELAGTEQLVVFQSKNDDKKVYVVLQGDLDRVPHQQYGLIHLKGHTKDMQPLIDMIKARPYLIKDNETILLLGGCDTARMLNLISSLKVIPIANKYIGSSANNDYLDLQLHTRLTSRNMSVEEALTDIRDSAPTTLEQYIIPTFR